MRRLFPWALAVVLGCAIGITASTLAWQERQRLAAFGPSGPPPREGGRLPWVGEQPNVVLVIGTSVRRDQVTPYGGHPAATPFLTELAESGSRFSGAIAAAPSTRAANTVIATGQPFRAIGMARSPGTANQRRLAPEATTIAERFREAGYWAIGGASDPSLAGVFGFDQGFFRYHDVSDLGRRDPGRVAGSQVVDRLLREIDRPQRRNAPLFLQIELSDADPPGSFDERELAQFADDRSPVRLQKYRVYLNRFDTALRRLSNGLLIRGFDDSNTIFVVVSDHGAGLAWPPDPGADRSSLLTPPVVEMVWMARGRGVRAGGVVPGLASQVDVLPTLAGLAGVQGYAGPGRDWSLPLRDGGTTDRDLVFVDSDSARSDQAAAFGEQVACEWSRRTETPIVRCFDRRADPYHRTALAVPDPVVSAALQRWRAGQDEASAAWTWTGDATLTPEQRAWFDSPEPGPESPDPGEGGAGE